MFNELDHVLKSCDMDVRAFDFRQYFDPENTNCVTWQNFLRTVELIKEQSKISWECAYCTFFNKKWMTILVQYAINKNQCNQK